MDVNQIVTSEKGEDNLGEEVNKAGDEMGEREQEREGATETNRGGSLMT